MKKINAHEKPKESGQIRPVPKSSAGTSYNEKIIGSNRIKLKRKIKLFKDLDESAQTGSFSEDSHFTLAVGNSKNEIT